MLVNQLLKDAVEKRFPFFEPELKEAIVQNGILRNFEEGEEIIREGQFIKSFPLVLEGVIRVSRLDLDESELLLYYLGAGEVCTMSLTCCMSRMRSNVKGYTEETSSLIFIPVELLDRWMTEFQSWKEFVMYSYRKRFDEMLNTIDSIAFMNMDERLMKFFIDRYRSTGSTIYNGKHQDIAMALHSSREVISRLLKKLENIGKIQLSRNRIDFSKLV